MSRIVIAPPSSAAVYGLLLFGGLFLTYPPLRAQEVIRPDLSGIPAGDGWVVENRAATVRAEASRGGTDRRVL
jgi:hypothetical protein